MTVYNINLGIGWASSGVEYAQMYRATAFRNSGIEAKFIFTDLILDENIIHFTQNLNYKDEEIIWLYNYFTDMPLTKTTYTLEQLEATVPFKYNRVEKNGKVVRYIYDDQEQMLTAYLVSENSNLVNRAEYVSRGNLIRKDFYTTKVFMTEYYIPRDNRAYLYQRKYFNNNGSVAYEEYLDNGKSIFKFPDKIVYSKEELMEYFLKKLELTNEDIVILDRATVIGQAVLKNATPAKLGVVVHADHFSENSTDDSNILWNNYYEYTFSNHNIVDFYITSTDAQTNLLKEQFKKYYDANPKIYTVPVGSIDCLTYPESSRKAYSLITASRLAGEKNIPVLVDAVARLKNDFPELTFDIYGSGGEEGKISELIKKHGAEDYIKLKGHHNLKDIYKNYEVYITASGSEGFGLTLLEAIGSGLPIVGFNVRYGNPTFIRDGKNGYLIPRDIDDTAHLTNSFEKYLRKLLEEKTEKNLHEESYKVAERFLTLKVEQMWLDLCKEVLK